MLRFGQVDQADLIDLWIPKQVWVVLEVFFVRWSRYWNYWTALWSLSRLRYCWVLEVRVKVFYLVVTELAQLSFQPSASRPSCFSRLAWTCWGSSSEEYCLLEKLIMLIPEQANDSLIVPRVPHDLPLAE